jgi:antitoxin StbD
MQSIYASHAASISELKKNPSQLIDEANGQPIAILNHNNATAYLVPAATFEKILEHLDDAFLQKIIRARLHDGKKPIRVNINEI